MHSLIFVHISLANKLLSLIRGQHMIAHFVENNNRIIGLATVPLPFR